MITEQIETYVSSGSKIKVHGKRTQTTGVYRGLAVTEEGHPSVVLTVEGAAMPFAYRLDEIERIEYQSPATTGPDHVGRVEGELP